MPEAIQIPYCSICLEYMSASRQFIVLPRCGHMFCVECANKFFDPPTSSKRCPYCTKPHKRTELIQVFAHDRPYRSNDTSFTASPPTQHNTQRSRDAPQRQSTDKDLVRLGDRTIAALKRLSDVEPESWQTVFLLQGFDGSRAFTDARTFLNTVGDEVDDSLELKRVLRGLGVALADLRKLYDRIVDLAKSKASLERRFDAAMKDSQTQARRHKEELKNRDVILTAEKEACVVKETASNSRVMVLNGKLKSEIARRQAAEAETENVQKDLEKWRSECARYKKKYYATKEEFRQHKRNAEYGDEAGSSSGLEILHDEDPVLPPPLSQPSTSQSSSQRSQYEEQMSSFRSSSPTTPQIVRASHMKLPRLVKPQGSAEDTSWTREKRKMVDPQRTSGSSQPRCESPMPQFSHESQTKVLKLKDSQVTSKVKNIKPPLEKRKREDSYLKMPMGNSDWNTKKSRQQPIGSVVAQLMQKKWEEMG